jgi:hypothetical protein
MAQRIYFLYDPREGAGTDPQVDASVRGADFLVAMDSDSVRALANSLVDERTQIHAGALVIERLIHVLHRLSWTFASTSSAAAAT